jgi:hypothetical protein
VNQVHSDNRSPMLDTIDMLTEPTVQPFGWHQDCETWVPLGPHRPGSRLSPTSGSGLLEDMPTCQWAQLT